MFTYTLTHLLNISLFSRCSLNTLASFLLIPFSTGSTHVAVGFAFSAQVFFRVVFKGASSCFLSGYLPGPDKEVRLPAVSALNQRAAFSAARLTYTVKRLSQQWRSRLCVKRQPARGGDWKNKWIYVRLLFANLSGYSLSAQHNIGYKHYLVLEKKLFWSIARSPAEIN